MRLCPLADSAVLEEERASDRSELRGLEDDAIRSRSGTTAAPGCGTDCEFRRWMFMNPFYDAVDGVRTGKSVTFRNDRGEDVRLNIHEIVGRFSAIDLRRLAKPRSWPTRWTDIRFKVTFPAPPIFGHPLTTVVGPDQGGYGSLEEFVWRTRSRIEARTRRGRNRRRSPIRPVHLPPCIRTWWIRRGSRVSKRLAMRWIGASRPRSPQTLPCWRASPTTSPRAPHLSREFPVFVDV